jgi:hypothetical protein
LPAALIALSKHACFGSAVSSHQHRSETCDATMRFAVYAPPGESSIPPSPKRSRDSGPIRAEGTIVTMGRRATFTDARLVDVHGCLYASATSSLLVMHPT